MDEKALDENWVSNIDSKSETADANVKSAPNQNIFTITRDNFTD